MTFQDDAQFEDQEERKSDSGSEEGRLLLIEARPRALQAQSGAIDLQDKLLLSTRRKPDELLDGEAQPRTRQL